MGRIFCLLFTLALSVAVHAGNAVVVPSRGAADWVNEVEVWENNLFPNFFFFDCEKSAAPMACPARVFFGTEEVHVRFVSQNSVVVRVNPQSPRTVDITVRIAGRDDLVVRNGYTFLPMNSQAVAETYKRYLVPLVPREVPGAQGSLWKTELSVAQRVHLYGAVCDPHQDAICQGILLDDQKTHHPRVYAPLDGRDGAFVYVREDAYPSFALRVRDVTRNAENLGTGIPLPREDEFKFEMDFLDVPTDPRYRATLRVYSTSAFGSRVFVEIYKEEGGERIDFRDLDVPGEPLPADPLSASVVPPNPGYLQIDPLTPAARAAGERVRVHVEVANHQIASPAPPPVWAFVSITNNQTQQVTTITPSR